MYDKHFGQVVTLFLKMVQNHRAKQFSFQDLKMLKSHLLEDFYFRVWADLQKVQAAFSNYLLLPFVFSRGSVLPLVGLVAVTLLLLAIYLCLHSQAQKKTSMAFSAMFQIKKAELAKSLKATRGFLELCTVG